MCRIVFFKAVLLIVIELEVVLNFLRNCWYVVAFDDEINEKPLARRVLGVDLVIYRGESGTVQTLEDRCPHRFAPLSQGRIVGEGIECPYHGLHFGSDGACVYNPHYKALPAAARVKNYPTLERYGVIWVWMGGSTVEPGPLPDEFHFLEDPALKTVRGYLNVQGNYQLIVDNLLDLTHVAYLHPGFAIPGYSSEDRLKSTESELITEKNRVTIRRWRHKCPPSTPNREVFGFRDDVVNARSHMHWMPPALIYFDAGIARIDEPDEEGLCMPAMHAITPETELSSHYFFQQSRNMLIEDPEIDAVVLGLLENAFRNEDEPMIEAQQKRMGATSDLMSLQPVLLKTDGAPVSARRILTRLIENEELPNSSDE